MQVICISKGTVGGGKDLAERLADKLGYACVSREELIEAATREGIQVGKLEMAMIKPRAFNERLSAEKEYYLAFCTAYLCDRAGEGNVVYHGRTGHLLLPGVSHVLRVRVIDDYERRILRVMNELGIERDKARKYIDDVDMDRRQWAKSMYGVSLEEAVNYDIVINLEHMSVENAASALVGVSQLPDYQMTPASKKMMLDLQLGAKARLALASDSRTFRASFKVRADSGLVTATYLPQDSKLAGFIPEILKKVPAVRDIRTTMAMTNILWIQETFEPHTETFEEVSKIATKWGAAVELMRLAPQEELRPEEAPDVSREKAPRSGSDAYNGGIEEDTPEESRADGGISKTLDELARNGRSGGGKSVYGNQHNLVESLDRTIPYTLVVIGDVFQSKGHSAKLRATRDLRSFLSDHIKAPVVTSDELGSHYLFGKRDVVRTSVFLVVTVVLYALVFTHQDAILEFLANAGWYADATRGTFLGHFSFVPKIIISLAVFVTVPVVAYVYGSIAGAILKLIKME